MNRRLLPFRRSGFLGILVAIFCIGFAATARAQESDLGVVKSGPSLVVAGTDVTYTVSVSYVSGGASTPTNTLSDTLPAGMTFVSIEADPNWTCVTPAVGGTGTITCTYDNPITEEQSFFFTFVFHLDSGVSNGTIISNTATISHEGTDPNSSNDSSTAMSEVGTPPPPPLAVHDVLISEFRLSGPGGASDEYIEFYCNRDTDCNIGLTILRAYDPNLGDDFSITFPPGTIIPARHYLLIADFTQYSLFDYGIPDFDVHDSEHPDFFADNEGFQLLGSDDPIVLDSVGFIGGGNDTQYIEGTGLQRATSTRPADQYAYVRQRPSSNNGLPADTDNNANDFVLVSVTGTAHPGIAAPPVLGAPGPQGLTSPLSYNNSQVPASLIEPDADLHSTPNQVRTGSGDSGTISFRRSFTNNTNEFFDYIAFRVTALTTLNNRTSDQAELRLITSPDAEVFMNSQGRTVIIRGTILEYDAGCGCEPAQPNGGGLNTTVTVDLDQIEGIDPGETIDVQFLFNVVHAGNYRFFVYVEAFPVVFEDGPATSAPRTAKTRLRAPRASAPRKLINLKRGLRTNPFNKKPKQPLLPTKKINVPIIRPPMSTTASAPVRVWINLGTPTSTAKRQKKKTRLRRKASAALRAKADAKYVEQKSQN